jgi:hypothetical protein
VEPVNTTREHHKERTALVPVDPRRHALEARVVNAKERLIEDLNQASMIVKQAASTAGRGIARILAMGALVVAGLLTAFLRRRRRLRVTWK